MKVLQLNILIVLTYLVLQTSGAKILVLLPLGSKSHKNVFIPLMEELSKRNHEITQITLFKSADKLKGMTTIYLEEANRIYEEMGPRAANMSTVSLAMISEMSYMFRMGCEVIYNDPLIKEFRAKHEHFDVTLVSSIMNECYMPMAQEVGAPVIMVSPSALFANVAWDLNIPNPWSYVPLILTPYSAKMTFKQRINNVLAHIAYFAVRKFVIGPAVDAVSQTHIPNAVTGLDSSNISLVLVNSHFSVNDPRPTMPYMIEVGGMHCRPAEKLPKEFEDFIKTSGDDGFIVFSMGSVVQGQYLPEYFVNAFRSAFSKLKQKVIWKFEKPLEGLSPNVMISKWIPQQDLMGHPKCRLAITHGGLLSLQEVAYHGVPLLGVPFGADRDSNINQAIQQGFAELVDHTTLTSEILVERITNMLTNKKYKEKAAEISSLMKDRPQHPVETGAYWVEYIIRHKGAKHLKSAADQLNFFQYFLLDVIAFISLIAIVALAIAVFLIKKIVKFARNKFCSGTCSKPKIVKSPKVKSN